MDRTVLIGILIGIIVSGGLRPLGCSAGFGLTVWRPVPRHQFVNAALGPSVDQARQQIHEIDLRIDVVQLAGLCRAPNYAERARFSPKRL